MIVMEDIKVFFIRGPRGVNVHIIAKDNFARYQEDLTATLPSRSTTFLVQSLASHNMEMHESMVGELGSCLSLMVNVSIYSLQSRQVLVYISSNSVHIAKY